MISKENLRQIVIRQKHRKKIDNLVKRELFDRVIKYLNDKRILIVSGLRRCGKSTLLFEIMEELKKKNKNFCYVNFEDEKFLDFQAKDFEMLEEVLIEIYGDFNYYFFDEVQNIPLFESFVRRLHDEGKKIILTGSNSSLLSKELGTKLTGRYKIFELYPFSFKEFLVFNKTEHDSRLFSLSKEKVNLLKKFSEYFRKGGVPEYLENNDIDYIRTIYDNILYRDIIARYSIKNQKIFRELVNILATNISSQFSYNSLKNILKLSNAILVKEYIFYLVNTYLFFELRRFDFSIRKQLNFPKKLYFIDNAFSEVVGFNFSKNNGRLLENLVYVHLRRIGREVFYFQEKRECDFILKDKTKIKKAIQVCYELDNKNREREVEGLIEAMEMFNLKKGLILTYDFEDEITVNKKQIKIIPVWKFLLEAEKYLV